MIGILFNCQGQGIAAALEAMLPSRRIVHMHGGAFRTDNKTRAEALEQLAQCDDVITAPMGPEMRQLSTVRLRRAVKRLHVMPPVNFRGFHPDTIYILDSAREPLRGITGDYQSRIAAVGFLAGMSVEETAQLYNGVVYSRLGYFRAYAEDFELLTERYARFEIDAAALLAQMRASSCFMHSGNHPKAWVLQAVARIACGMMGEPQDRPLPEAMEDFLELQPIHPLFEEIARRIGVPAEGAFRSGHARGQQPHDISTLDFVRDSFNCFARVSPECLRRADGVVEALSTLALDRAASAPATAARSGDDMALLSTQGTILRLHHDAAPASADAASRETPVLHAPLSFDAAQPPVLRLNINIDALPAEMPVLGGVTVVPAPLPGMVALRRDGRFLGADPGTTNARFLRDGAGDAESFKPVSSAAMAILQTLVAYSWIREDKPAAAALPAPRLAAGPALMFGDARVDLRRQWPQPLAPDRNGAPRAALELDGVPLIVRAEVRPIGQEAFGQEAFGQQARGQETPAPAKTVAPGRRLVVSGTRAWLPPPLTVCNADRLWLHEHCGDPSGLPWVIEAPALTIRRESGRMAGEAPWFDGEPPVAGVPYSGPVVTQSSVLVEGPPHGEGGTPEGIVWAASLIRLLAIAPYLPEGSQVVAPASPGAPAALASAWQALGYDEFAWAPQPATVYRADDLIWCEPEAPWALPAESLRAVRDAVVNTAVVLNKNAGSSGKAAGERAVGKRAAAKRARVGERLFLRGAAAHLAGYLPALEPELMQLGYAALDLTREAPPEILRRLQQAVWLIGTGDDLVVSAFCPANVKVLELCPAVAFEQKAWRQSCALGVLHAVLPCPVDSGTMTVDIDRLKALLKMARMRL